MDTENSIKKDIDEQPSYEAVDGKGDNQEDDQEDNQVCSKKTCGAFFIAALAAYAHGTLKAVQFCNFLEYLGAIERTEEIDLPIVASLALIFSLGTFALGWHENNERYRKVLKSMSEEKISFPSLLCQQFKNNIRAFILSIVCAICEGAIIFVTMNEFLYGEQKHFEVGGIIFGFVLALFSSLQLLIGEGKALVDFFKEELFIKEGIYYFLSETVYKLDFDPNRGFPKRESTSCLPRKTPCTTFFANVVAIVGAFAAFALSFDDITSIVEETFTLKDRSLQFAIGLIGLLYALVDWSLYGGTVKSYCYGLVSPRDCKEFFRVNPARFFLSFFCAMLAFMTGIVYFMSVRDLFLFVNENEDATYHPTFIVAASLIALAKAFESFIVEGIKIIAIVAASDRCYATCGSSPAKLEETTQTDKTKENVERGGESKQAWFVYATRFIAIAGLKIIIEQVITPPSSKGEIAASYLLVSLISAIVSILGFERQIENQRWSLAFKVFFEIAVVTVFGYGAQQISNNSMNVDIDTSEIIGGVMAGVTSVFVNGVLFSRKNRSNSSGQDEKKSHAQDNGTFSTVTAAHPQIGH